MALFTVLDQLVHDQKSYEVGDTIELAPEYSKPLVALGVIVSSPPKKPPNKGEEK